MLWRVFYSLIELQLRRKESELTFWIVTFRTFLKQEYNWSIWKRKKNFFWWFAKVSNSEIAVIILTWSMTAGKLTTGLTAKSSSAEAFLLHKENGKIFDTCVCGNDLYVYLSSKNSRVAPGIPLIITDAFRWHSLCSTTPFIFNRVQCEMNLVRIKFDKTYQCHDGWASTFHVLSPEAAPCISTSTLTSKISSPTLIFWLLAVPLGFIPAIKQPILLRSL